MTNASPLRYPGGKGALACLLRDIRTLNGLGDRAFVEPFAGGAGAALKLLFLEDTPEIRINDADPAIHAFWWSAINRPAELLRLLSRTRVNITQWRKQRAYYRARRRKGRVSLGFAAFYLNRCNRSGIILDGGPIGGIEQEGRWTIDARYNKRTLAQRLMKIAEYRQRIRVSGDDGLAFIASQEPESTFLFIDPPYFEKGGTLYLNGLDAAYHASLAERLRTMANHAWALTYDDCTQVRRLYRGWAAVRPFSLRYTASGRRTGREVLITPKWMRLPSTQPSDAIQW